MGIVLASTAISLDGFIAGPNHEMDWVFDHHFLPEGPIDIVEEVIALRSGARQCPGRRIVAGAGVRVHGREVA